MDMLQEQIPSGTSVLIVGPPGSGKTILSQQMVHNMLESSKSAIYVAPKNQINMITSQGKLFTWNITPELKTNRFTMVEIGDIADPTELNISLTQAIRSCRKPLSLVVLDSLTTLMVGMEERRIMKFTEALIRKLQDQDVGLLLLATPTKETEDFLTKMKSLVSSVIEIKLEERGTLRRYVRIFKFLEKKHSTQWYSFEITDSGIQFPASLVKPPPDVILLPRTSLIEETYTPYPGLDNLLKRIKKDRLSCIMEAQFSSGQGILLFSEGEPLVSLMVGKDGSRSNAPRLLEAAVKTRKGTLTISSVTPEAASLLVGYLQDQALFRNLSSDQIRFEGILNSLAESEFSGCVLLRGDEEQGLIFIDKGEVVEAYFENEKALHSKEALSAFEEAASRGNFQVDIYFSARVKEPSEVKEKPVPVKMPEALLPEFIPAPGSTIRGVFINATLKYLQEKNSAEWSSTMYYPRPLQDIAINKVENELLRLKTMNDPYLKRDTYKLRSGYRDREWYPVEEYQDIVYAATRMLEFSWNYEHHDQYEEGWGTLSRAYFELGKTVPACMGIRKENANKNVWFENFIREIKQWKDMGSFSDLESRKEDKKIIMIFKGDVELPPRRKGMLWGLLEGLGLSKFHISLGEEGVVITFG